MCVLVGFLSLGPFLSFREYGWKGLRFFFLLGVASRVTDRGWYLFDESVRKRLLPIQPRAASCVMVCKCCFCLVTATVGTWLSDRHPNSVFESLTVALLLFQDKGSPFLTPHSQQNTTGQSSTSFAQMKMSKSLAQTVPSLLQLFHSLS